MYESVVKEADVNSIPLNEIEKIELASMTFTYPASTVLCVGEAYYHINPPEPVEEYQMAVTPFKYKSLEVSITFPYGGRDCPFVNKILNEMTAIILSSPGAVEDNRLQKNTSEMGDSCRYEYTFRVPEIEASEKRDFISQHLDMCVRTYAPSIKDFSVIMVDWKRNTYLSLLKEKGIFAGFETTPEDVSFLPVMEEDVLL